MKIDKLQGTFAVLVVVASLSLLVMGYGLYKNGQDIQELQNRTCLQLQSLSARISTRTEPIRMLLRLEANEAKTHGHSRQSALLRRLEKLVIVPNKVRC